MSRFNDFFFNLCSQNASATERGCLMTTREISECDKSQQCTTCSVTKTGACNTNEFPIGRRKCVDCNSSDGEKCPAIDSTTIITTTKYCKNTTDSCVVLNKGGNVHLQKCSENLAKSDIDFCKKNSDSCIACSSNNCNLRGPLNPSASSTLGAYWMYSFAGVAIQLAFQ